MCQLQAHQLSSVCMAALSSVLIRHCCWFAGNQVTLVPSTALAQQSSTSTRNLIQDAFLSMGNSAAPPSTWSWRFSVISHAGGIHHCQKLTSTKCSTHSCLSLRTSTQMTPRLTCRGYKCMLSSMASMPSTLLLGRTAWGISGMPMLAAASGMTTALCKWSWQAKTPAAGISCWQPMQSNRLVAQSWWLCTFIGSFCFRCCLCGDRMHS